MSSGSLFKLLTGVYAGLQSSIAGTLIEVEVLNGFSMLDHTNWYYFVAV